MSAVKVKLVRGLSGHTHKHRTIVLGLGLKKVGHERLLPDTPATHGMIAKVGYLLEWSRVDEDFVPFGRRAQKG